MLRLVLASSGRIALRARRQSSRTAIQTRIFVSGKGFDVRARLAAERTLPGRLWFWLRLRLIGAHRANRVTAKCHTPGTSGERLLGALSRVGGADSRTAPHTADEPSPRRTLHGCERGIILDDLLAGSDGYAHRTIGGHRATAKKSPGTREHPQSTRCDARWVFLTETPESQFSNR
jgi:hypothetical protein